jgi:hypothetical protein
MAEVPNSSTANDQEININLDIDMLAKALFNDQGFIIAVAEAVRKQMTKDARRTGNLFGQWAQGR